MRRGSAIKYHGQRVAFLKDNLELTEGVPALNQDVTPDGSAKLSVLELRMVQAGLFGKTTNSKQARGSRRETVRRLIGELRAGRENEVHW